MNYETAKQRNSETNQKPEGQNARTPRFDLEERTLQFAKRVRRFVKHLPNTIANQQDIKQIVRSSGSVGANYLEANESLSKKDFLMRIKISKKEAKETIYWLELLETPDSLQVELGVLSKEATEIMKILGAIERNTKA